jgi:hypothetical protein
MKSLMAAALTLALAPSDAEAAVRVTVIGDSHANGIAHAVHRVDPDIVVNNLSKGGTASWQMSAAPDDGSVVIVSAGTVDCGAREPDERMVDGIRRVLGPFADGSQKGGGALVYVRPHDRIRGQYEWVNPRIARLNAMADDRSLGVPSVADDEEVGPDGIHLTRDGYDALARLALLRASIRTDSVKSGDSEKWDRLSDENAETFYSQKCPDCGSKVVSGPRGGLSVNWDCVKCGSGFNDLGPFGVERVTEVSPGRATSRRRP